MVESLTYLPEEWTPFDGDYKKCMQDIELKDGTILRKCYPNAGVFVVFGTKHKDVPVSDVKAVKKHNITWD